MSSSGLIYAAIVGAWAAYLVPMWLRRQDELNEARPTERFSTAIRLLSGRAGMERRYAKDLRARSAAQEEPGAEPDVITDSVDVRAFAVPPTDPGVSGEAEHAGRGASGRGDGARDAAREPARGRTADPAAHAPGASASSSAASAVPASSAARGPVSAPVGEPGAGASGSAGAPADESARARRRVPRARRALGGEAAAARARRTKVLARRRRTTVVLFLAFTLGSIVAAVGGLAFLWAPGVPAVLLSAYIAYLRVQERRRFAYQMDRRRAEAAAQRLKERARRPRRRPAEEALEADEPEPAPEPAEPRSPDPELSALAAGRRALVEQTDHAEWVDQQRERQRRPGQGDSWDPVPVPLPTYVTAPVAPRAGTDVDLGAPDAWSSARSGTAGADREALGLDAPPAVPAPGPAAGADDARRDAARRDAGARDGVRASDTSSVPVPQQPSAEHAQGAPSGTGGRSGARRAASARRARERGRTPLFDQYEDGERPRAANE